jgi:hypothetical protein
MSYKYAHNKQWVNGEDNRTLVDSARDFNTKLQLVILYAELDEAIKCGDELGMYRILKDIKAMV